LKCENAYLKIGFHNFGGGKFLLIIVNATIVTFDEEYSFIENGYIKIDKDVVTHIGTIIEMKYKISKGEIKIEENEKIIDAQGKILMPGFISTHTHACSTLIRGLRFDNQESISPLEMIKRNIESLESQLTHEDIYYGTLVALIEGIKNGVTCFFDHHSSPLVVEGSLDVIEEAFRKLGARGVLSYSISDKQGIGIALKGIKENSRFVEKCRHDNEDLIKGMFGIHDASNLPSKVLEIAALEGNRLSTGFHIHVAETMGDLISSRTNFQKGIVERLEEYNLLNSKSMFSHCIHINENEKKLLNKVNVIHNPESNMNFAVGYCDAIDLMKKGNLVGIGTDGFPLDVLRAMNICYGLHIHHGKDTNVIRTEDVVEMAIINNGKIASKHYDSQVGSIKVGAKADLILIDYNSPTVIDGDNISAHMIFGMNSGTVSDVIINGKVVMENRVICDLDEKAVYAKCKLISKALWERV
jgi:putative selenium metabolism protein SsnA